MKINKTFSMPEALGKAWFAALRSGDYNKGTSTLCDTVENPTRFCCLGVLQMVADGKCESLTVPSYEWLKKNNVNFENNVVDAGMRMPFVYINDELIPITDVNDGILYATDACLEQNYTFSEIADLLEGHCSLI
jgi:hypothetical protein